MFQSTAFSYFTQFISKNIPSGNNFGRVTLYMFLYRVFTFEKLIFNLQSNISQMLSHENKPQTYQLNKYQSTEHMH